MAMHLTSARPWVITGPDTFTTASSWAWAHGAAGAIATAGAGIALLAKAEAATTAGLDGSLIAAMAAVVGRFAAVVERVPARGVSDLRVVMAAADRIMAAVVDRTMAVVVVAKPTAVVVDRVMVAVVDTAADTTKHC